VDQQEEYYLFLLRLMVQNHHLFLHHLILHYLQLLEMLFLDQNHHPLMLWC
tara:strand:+ start:392 stop:544 length:153 start_codon:yes stop_codon:yes gene_type:complete